jgi:hypothetical protein
MFLEMRVYFKNSLASQCSRRSLKHDMSKQRIDANRGPFIRGNLRDLGLELVDESI